jgi:small subunit ribosomal protein S18
MQQCYFCTNNIKEIDYKEADTLKRFLDPQSRILSQEKTGLCSKHQRKLARAIKNSRIMGLLPFISR